MTKKIWGIEYTELFDGERLFWLVKIKKPFFKQGWKVGLNQKFLKMAQKSGVEKIIIQVGQKEIMMDVPDAKQLQELEKKGEFEDKPSLFEGCMPMRIYYFGLN